MEYKLKIGENAFLVEVDLQEGNIFAMTIDGKKSEVVYERISDHQINIAVDGKRVNAFISDNADEKSISINGAFCSVIDEDALAQKKTSSSSHHIPNEITPTIPSVVVAILATVGDVVEKGQKLIVLSAMKMETALMAPYRGTVTKINAAVGDKKKPGDILVELTKADEA